MSDYVIMTNMSSSEGDDLDSDTEMPEEDRKEEEEDLKRRRRRRKEEATYGIFGDLDYTHYHSTGTAAADGDNDIAGVGMNRRQRRKLQQERLSKPVGFVSASASPSSMLTSQQQTTSAAQVKVDKHRRRSI